jgi:anthranilate/para-aminobenzoate synthase component II
MRTVSSTRWPTISARPAPRSSPIARPLPTSVFHDVDPDLVVLSPGPGNPKDFDCAATIGRARARGLPIFGVCLGLQA